MLTAGVCLSKKDYWSRPDVLAEHAANRKRKYHDDPETARREKARQRKIYREKKGAEFHNPARDALANFSTDRTYTGDALSELIGRAPEYINRLINRKLWPDPRNGSPNAQVVFDGEIAKRLVEVFADHVDNIADNYRGDHHETTAALFAAMKKEG